MKNSEKSPEQRARELENTRRYRENNKEKCYESHRRYRERNRKKINARSRELRKQNIVAYRQRANDRRKENLERYLDREQKYRTKNQGKINDYMNDRRRSIKQQCLEYLGGGICFICGHTSKWGCEFDFHHCTGKKEFSISKKIADGICDFELFKKELDKCKVLCRNCHSVVTSTVWKCNDFPFELREKIMSLLKNNP